MYGFNSAGVVQDALCDSRLSAVDVGLGVCVNHTDITYVDKAYSQLYQCCGHERAAEPLGAQGYR